MHAESYVASVFFISYIETDKIGLCPIEMKSTLWMKQSVHFSPSSSFNNSYFNAPWVLFTFKL